MDVNSVEPQDPGAAFPTVEWGRQVASFLEEGASLPASARVEAALVFAVRGSAFVLADIAGRGWCVPGGRLEAGETPEQAVRREAMEEAGAVLGPLVCIGHFVLTDLSTGDVDAVPSYRARVIELRPVPPGYESTGVRLVEASALPGIYYRWDALLEAVFAYAEVTGQDLA